MKLKSTAGKDFSADLAPAGTHAAVCVAVVDLGTHTPLRGYQGKPPSPARKLFVVWELTEEATRPVVWKDFTASLNEKAALRKFLKAWRGRDVAEGEEFDIGKICGAKCLLTVSHTEGERKYAVVEGAAPPMKGMTVSDPERSPFTWFLDDGEPFHGPGWELPFWYGRPVEEVIADCAEMRAESGQHTDEYPEGGSQVIGPDEAPF